MLNCNTDHMMEVIKVNIKLFGTLRNHLPEYDTSSGINVALREGHTIRDLLEVMDIPKGETMLCFVGGAARKLTYELEESDEVNIFLPLGGG